MVGQVDLTRRCEGVATIGLPAPVVVMILRMALSGESSRESVSPRLDSTAGGYTAALVDGRQTRFGTDAVHEGVW